MAKIPIEITSESDDAQRDLKALEQSLSGLEQAGQEAQDGLDGVGAAGDEAARGAGAAGDGAEQASDSFKIAGLSLTDLKSGLDMAGQALQKVGQAYDATVGAVLAYSDQVRDLARISGASTEETSRLIQASDDLQVEYSTLEQAAKALAKDGIALTTEELAKASDEYLAIEDAGERAEYATTRFGRAGLELTKVLETGGAALREMAAATDENLVMTEEQVKAARDLEVQLDNLEDSVMGVKLAVGNALIPALVDAIEKMMAFGGAIKKTLTVNEDIASVVKQHSTEVLKTAKSYDEWYTEMVRVAKVAGYNVSATGELTRAVVGANGAVTQVSVGVNLLTDYYKNMADEGTRAAAAADRFKKSNDDLAPAITITTSAIDLNAAALEAQERDLADATTASGTLRTDMALTAGQVSDLTSKYGSLSNAQLYNILVAGLDKDAAISLGIAMGILSPQVIAARDAAESLNKKYQLGAIDAATYAGRATELAAAIAKLQDKSITITTYYNNVGQPMTPEQQAANNPNNPNGPGQSGGSPEIDRSGVIYYNAPVAPDNPDRPDKYAQGGTYTIPPGYNESWPVGPNAVASSGETVTVTPKGEAAAAPMGGDKAVLDVLTSILDAINKLDRPAVAPMQVSISGYMGDAASLVAEFERQQQINAMMR